MALRHCINTCCTSPISVSAAKPAKTKSRYFPAATSPSLTMSQTAPQMRALDKDESIEAISLVAVFKECSSSLIFA